jgi:hypothetical protein
LLAARYRYDEQFRLDDGSRLCEWDFRATIGATGLRVTRLNNLFDLPLNRNSRH